MSYKRLAALLGAAFLAASVGLTGGATAGIHLNRDAHPGKGCGEVVTVKHPDLKGKARKAEWDKCMANPDSYGNM